MSTRTTDEYLRKIIRTLKKSAARHRSDIRPGKRRFGIYKYLTDVYQVFLEFHSTRKAKTATRRIAKICKLSIWRKSHPIRDPDRSERWSRRCSAKELMEPGAKIRLRVASTCGEIKVVSSPEWWNFWMRRKICPQQRHNATRRPPPASIADHASFAAVRGGEWCHWAWWRRPQ